MAKKIISPIPKLEKALIKLKQRLAKAHSAKVAKLEKTSLSAANKLKKAQAKLAAFKGKKTASAIRQREAAQSALNALKIELALTKNHLASAKADNKKHQVLMKAEEAATTIAKTVKKSPKKKTVKKNASSPNKQSSLTPDLTVPVVDKSTKPKKTWKPKAAKKTQTATPNKAINQSADAKPKAFHATTGKPTSLKSTQKEASARPNIAKQAASQQAGASALIKQTQPDIKTTTGAMPSKLPGAANESSKIKDPKTPTVSQEPSAGKNKQPSAERRKEPSAADHKQSSVVGTDKKRLSEADHKAPRQNNKDSSADEKLAKKELNWLTMPLVKSDDPED